jgi:predicted nuclease of predicted toxin-antitoxin system
MRPTPAIFELAADTGRVIVAADTDFGELLTRRRTAEPSLVLFRRQTGRRPSEQAALLIEHLADVALDLTHGAVVVIQDTRLRVRSLPIGPRDE